jgi:membrane protease YdiL (CAAX protease family)
MIVISCFMVIYGLGYRLICKRKLEVDPADSAVRMFSIQRTILERMVFLPILFLGVISEELLYRGYLVLILGNEVGPVLLWILLSVLLSVVAHLYQGRSRIIWHLLFAIIATSTTALTGSILMSTAMHLYVNLISALKVWSMADKTIAKQKDVTSSEQIPNTAV